jgi:hypothetical protein
MMFVISKKCIRHFLLGGVYLIGFLGIVASGGGGGGDVTEPPPEPPIEPPPDIVCGEIITENTSLQADLVCLGDAPTAIEFGASFITLDLNGYSIVDQSPVGSVYTSAVEATDKEGITIRNGMIIGFDEQVFLSRSHNSIVSNMTFKDPRVGAMNLLHSQELVVEDSLFDLPVTDLPDVEVGGIGTWGGFTRIRNIEVINGAVGVAFGFPQFCDTAQSPSNGEVLNSRFAGAYLSSIYVTCSTDLAKAPSLALLRVSWSKTMLYTTHPLGFNFGVLRIRQSPETRSTTVWTGLVSQPPNLSVVMVRCPVGNASTQLPI